MVLGRRVCGEAAGRVQALTHIAVVAAHPLGRHTVLEMQGLRVSQSPPGSPGSLIYPPTVVVVVAAGCGTRLTSLWTEGPSTTRSLTEAWMLLMTNALCMG